MGQNGDGGGSEKSLGAPVGQPNFRGLLLLSHVQRKLPGPRHKARAAHLRRSWDVDRTIHAQEHSIPNAQTGRGAGADAGGELWNPRARVHEAIGVREPFLFAV